MSQSQTALARTSSEPMVAATARPSVTPPCDIYENADEILVVADLPGVPTDAVQIRLEKGELTLEARRDLPAEGSALSAEYHGRDFSRRFAVPAGIDGDRISA